MMKARTEEAKRDVAVGGGANLATLVEGGGRHRLAFPSLDETIDLRWIESSGKEKDEAQPWPSVGDFGGASLRVDAREGGGGAGR